MRLSLILLFFQLCGNVKVAFSLNGTCPKVPDVPHAHVSEETRQAEYQVGHVIHFTCETGYISGPTIRYMCTSDGWLPVTRVPGCYLKPCELPDDTPNGYYQIIHGENFVFGTTIKYFCNEGYFMVSKDDTRTCLLDKWTNHVPVCDPLSCEPPPADGQVTVKGLPTNDDPILPDRFLKFSCDNPGQYLNGSSTLICGKDGQWDEPFPTCEDITCTAGVMHHYLKAAGLPPANETMKTGHRLRFQCSHDYTLEGSTEIECLQTGQWNAPFPTCSAKCRVTGVPDNVRITPRVYNYQVRKGEKINFACRTRGQYIQGNTSVECLADGQWSGPFPTCGDPLGCGRPPALADGDIKESLQFQYRHGEQVEYICQSHYTMMGEPYKTCINGQWIGPMRCLKPCTVNEELMRQYNIAFRYGRKNKLYSPHNDEIEFKCVGQRRRVGEVDFRQRCVDGVMLLPTCQ